MWMERQKPQTGGGTNRRMPSISGYSPRHVVHQRVAPSCLFPQIGQRLRSVGAAATWLLIVARTTKNPPVPLTAAPILGTLALEGAFSVFLPGGGRDERCAAVLFPPRRRAAILHPRESAVNGRLTCHPFRV